MSHTQKFGTLLKNIAHDYKNQLGILETLLRDIQCGYQVDEDSCLDCLEAVRKINSLSKVLQLGGMELEEIDHLSQNKSSPIPKILSLLVHAIKEELKTRNTNDGKMEFILSASSTEYGSFYHEETIQCSSNILLKQIVLFLFPYPKAGTSSTSRTSIALARLIMSITESPVLELTLTPANDKAHILTSIVISKESC